MPGTESVQAPVVVVALHIAPATRMPMRSVDQVSADSGRGLDGDRYEGARHRHVTVQSRDELDAAAAELGAAIEPASTRRNITIAGAPVPRTPGHRLRIGDIELEVVREAAPCSVLDESVAPGARAVLRRRAGACCRVLVGGTASIGSPVELDP